MSQSKPARVVVTGVGAITAQGSDANALWENVRDGRVAIRDVEKLPMETYRTDLGGEVKDGRVTPSDLAATVYRHLGIDLDSQWTDLQGRPQPIITEGGRPIPELS